MSKFYNIAWEQESDLRLVKDNAWDFGRAIDSQIKNNQDVKAELERGREVFFRIQNGRFLAENVDGKELANRGDTSFQNYPDVLAYGVPEKEGEVSLHLESESRKQLQQRPRGLF